MNQINLICLGVRNMQASLAFYRDGLDFETSVKENSPNIVFFNNNGTKLELFPLEQLQKDIGGDKPPALSTGGFPGFTLAYNAKTEQEVDYVIEKAARAGATIIKQPQRVDWGGYSGYFTDPDGYYWEVAFSEHWKFDENNMLIID
ncbi:VOC family protein [Terribacillus sp. DMT04]|uniref:VOC family protein n=1 Tax=Terribacillus sp. DMT04 TaxID=2850441 RepID=UPI001C2BB6C8|nr:VOC family protein [Terribacillus sp. DMT04]QXE01902.1 VOC family protein [Terribacillus sp. DMT04]